jgi:hypothetical protein
MAIRRLATIAAHSENEGASVSACIHLLDRGWGKAVQTIDADGEIRVIIRHIIEGRDVAVELEQRPAIDHVPSADGET